MEPTLEQHLGRAALDWFASNKYQVLPPGFEQSPADQEMPGAPEGSGEDVAVDVGQAQGAPAPAMAEPMPKEKPPAPLAYQKKPPMPKPKKKVKPLPMKTK